MTCGSVRSVDRSDFSPLHRLGSRSTRGALPCIDGILKRLGEQRNTIAVDAANAIHGDRLRMHAPVGDPA
jgi:hypothetical protein